MEKPTLYALDLESTLTPEIWVTVAEKSGIQELRLTTRDVPDYTKLMGKRIEIARTHSLTLSSIQKIISSIEPLVGAKEFLNWLREKGPVIILSDTFYEFAIPLIKKFDFPALFCHSLSVDEKGYINDFNLRENGSKKESIAAFKNLGFNVIAIGDSHNDIGMLSEADRGFLIHAPENIVKDFPQFPSFHSYEELKKFL